MNLSNKWHFGPRIRPDVPVDYIKTESEELIMKKLYKSNSDRKLCGVCGGLGEYFSIDSNVVRLLFVVVGLMSAGGGAVFYLLAALLLPEE